MDEDNLLILAVQTWGPQMQTVIAIEEMSELTKELCKYFRNGDGEHIAEEIADCKIVLRQLELIFECEKKVDAWEKHKLERLEDRINAYVGKEAQSDGRA